MGKSFSEKNHIELIILGLLFLILTYRTYDIRTLNTKGAMDTNNWSSIQKTLYYQNTAIILTPLTLEFIDIESSLFPKNIFSYPVEDGSFFQDMELYSNMLYILSNIDLSILDISNPFNPRILNKIQITSYHNVVYYNSSVILFSEGNSTLLLNFSDNKTDELLNIDKGMIKKGIIQDNILFVLFEQSNLSIFNLSTQEKITSVKNDFKTIEDFFVRDHFLYTIQSDMIILYDISDEDHIEWIDNISYSDLSENYEYSTKKNHIFLGNEVGILTGVNQKGETHIFGLKYSENGIPIVFHEFYYAEAFSFYFSYLDMNKGFLIGSGVLQIIEISNSPILLFRVIDYIIIMFGSIILLNSIIQWYNKKKM